MVGTLVYWRQPATSHLFEDSVRLHITLVRLYGIAGVIPNRVAIEKHYVGAPVPVIRKTDAGEPFPSL